MNVYIKTAYEIEHPGDLNNYKSIMFDAGAKIIEEYVNYEDEEAVFHYSLDITKEDFDKRFKEEYDKFYN